MTILAEKRKIKFEHLHFVEEVEITDKNYINCSHQISRKAQYLEA
jgi:hypothetical protein